MSSVAPNNALNTQAQRPRRGRAATARVIPATFPLDDVELPSGGVILRSADRVDFRVYKSIMAIASPVFRDMFSLPQQPTTNELTNDGTASNDEQMVDGLPVIQVTEMSGALNVLLRTIYPVVPPSFIGMSLDGKVTDAEQFISSVCPILDAAVKYDMSVVVKELCLKLLQAADHVKANGAVVDDTLAVRIYALACRHKLRDVAHQAAFAALRGRVRGDFLDDLRKINAAQYLQLLEYHEKVVNAVVPLMSLARFPNCYTTQMKCTDCTSGSKYSFSPSRYWIEYESEASAVLRISPRSALIFSVEFMENKFKEKEAKTKSRYGSHSCELDKSLGICRPLSQYLREQIEIAIEKVGTFLLLRNVDIQN